MANPWEAAPVVGSGGSSANPWEAAPAITPTKPKAEKSTLRKIADVHPGVAAGETLLNLATGSVAAPISGLAGIGAAIGKGLGLTKADPAEVVRNVGGAMTYQPRTEGAQQALTAISKPFELLGQGADYAGGATAEATGSPFLGAAVTTGIQALPEIVGKGLKKPMATRLAKKTEALETQRALNAPDDAVLQQSRDAGYVFTPGVLKRKDPLSTAAAAETGGTKLDYASSIKNQKNTNRLAKEELGLPLDEAITLEALNDFREVQGNAYRQVKAVVPELTVTPEFKNALTGKGSKFEKAKAEFPSYFENPEISKLVQDLSKDKFSADAAIEMQKVLRHDGYANLKAFNDPKKLQLGEVQINAAKAIDALIDQNLAMQAPPGVKNFQSKLATNLQEARKKIAQSYAVEKALSEKGNVSAETLRKIHDKDKSLTGGLEQIARTAKSFKGQMRDIEKLPGTAFEGMSKMDAAKAAAAAFTGHKTYATLTALSQPVLKPLLLSDWYQSMSGAPSYTPGMGYTAPAAVFGSPLYPIAAIPRPPYQGPPEE